MALLCELSTPHMSHPINNRGTKDLSFQVCTLLICSSEDSLFFEMIAGVVPKVLAIAHAILHALEHKVPCSFRHVSF